MGPLENALVRQEKWQTWNYTERERTGLALQGGRALDFFDGAGMATAID